MPKWYEDLPQDAQPILGFYIAAFWELSTSRQLGQMPGPIPVREIRRSAREDYLLTKRNAWRFEALIRVLDGVFLADLSRSVSPQAQNDGDPNGEEPVISRTPNRYGR